MSDKRQFAGQAAVFSSALLMSTNGLFIKLLPWHPLVIAGIRSFIAVLLLVAIRLLAPPPKDAQNQRFPLWAAALSFSVSMITFVIANKLTAAANVILLQYSAPVWAALLGWVLVKEKPFWEQWGALVLVVFGLLFFFKDGLGSGAALGNGIAIFSGMVFGAYPVFLRMMKNGIPQDALILAHAITAVASIPFIFLYPPSLSASSVLSIIYMGTVQIGLASFLFSYGIKHVRAVEAMLTSVAEPILNPVWVLAITGERPSSSALIGGLIIIAAVVISSVIGKRRDDASAKAAAEAASGTA